jgi:hypothetical protein
MFPRWIERPVQAGLLLGILLVSCGFMDLRPIGVRTVPGEAYELLPESHSPVILRFDTEMERSDAERILNVSSGGGQVEGDLHWEGNDLYFVPAAGWTPGTAYTLNLSGTVYSLDGRELRLAKFLPFFVISRTPAPYLESFSPADGSSVGLSPEEGGSLELIFSRSMDRPSVEAAFSLEGITIRHFDWQTDDRVLKIVPEKPLSPWTVYRWTIGVKARSREGVPLGEAVSAQFITDRDRLFPQVLRIVPLVYSPPAGGEDGASHWFPSGENFEQGLGSGQGIGVEFNKPMDEETLRRCLRFEPSLSGRIESLSPSSLVFIPERDPEPETVYTLIVSGDTKDAGGLKMGEDYRTFFTPDIPFLRLPAITAEGNPPVRIEYPETGFSWQVPVTSEKILRLTLEFSHNFSPQAKLDTPFRISLDGYFPGTLPLVDLRFVHWLSENKVYLEWEDLSPGKAGEPHYYKLSVSGGRNGIDDGSGSFLKEDAYFYLEAVEQEAPE